MTARKSGESLPYIFARIFASPSIVRVANRTTYDDETCTATTSFPSVLSESRTILFAV